MQTIESSFVDKSTWPDGPWKDEPDKRQWRDEETGLPCLIVRHAVSGHLCGYVGVSHGHPLHGKQDYECDVSVHGGITYTDKCDGSRICHVVEPGEDDDVWWLGFDCAHSGDMISIPLCNKLHWAQAGTYKTVDYVANECRSLARQLKAMGAEDGAA